MKFFYVKLLTNLSYDHIAGHISHSFGLIYPIHLVWLITFVCLDFSFYKEFPGAE